jgi:hypothetical protein
MNSFLSKLFGKSPSPTLSDATRGVIDQMFAHGFEPGQEYAIEYAFFGEKAGLSDLRRELLAQGFKEDTTQSTEMIVLIQKLPLGYDTIGNAIAEMKVLAAKHHVTFDGWSCAV